MKIGIHHSKGSYSEGWIEYCKTKGIPFKIVNAYKNDIIKQLEDCDIFMWHFHQVNPKDFLFAKQLLFSLEIAGKKVYPNWRSSWSFDDKLGQKYLLEALNLPLIPTYVFFSKEEALSWAKNYSFPAVFKLRGGAGSSNVRLVKHQKDAIKLINKAFGKGFRQYDPLVLLKDKIMKYRKKEANLTSVIKEILHFIVPYQIEKSKSREKGYVYFQEFIPNCDHDIRIQFIGDKCYAMKRYTRKNDFRASGGGNIDYDGSKISKEVIKLGYLIADSLQMQTLAIDLIPYKDTYLLSEVSFAFAVDEGECDYGYYDRDIIWHEGKFDPYGWMVEEVLK
jgi:glutathione synthase/RimK-type ligase-like ATP-grasp enzyme